MSPPNPLIPRYLLVMTLSILAGLVVYQDAISSVLSAVFNRNDSSHGIFVPLISAFLLWTIRDRIKRTHIHYSWYGMALFVACLVPPLAGLGNDQVQFIAFIGCICALVLALLGKAVLRTVAFPLLFLITMTPLPPDLYERLASFSRVIAFGGSLEIISWLGIPHLRIGWDIELPNALLRVAESCSGIRYLISFIVFGTAYAYLNKVSAIGRIATVLAMIPISLFASICRLTVIFTMTYWVSPFWSQHGPHVVLSWFVFFTVLFASIFIDQWVMERTLKGERRGRRSLEQGAGSGEDRGDW
jgi:exosortase